MLGYGRQEVRCCKNCQDGRLNLLHVAKQGDQEATECLLRWGMHGKSTPRGRNVLHVACEQSAAAAVKCLTECGFATSEVDADGWSAMHISAALGDLYSLKYLIIAGADRNVLTQQGTPLHCASQHKMLDAVQYLVNRGVEVNARDLDGETPDRDRAGCQHYQSCLDV